MADAPHDENRHSERPPSVDVRVVDARREGLTGTTSSELYERRRDREDVTVAPDFRPMEDQPRWRRDFPVDWPQDQFVARRDFAKFMVLTSLAFVVGQLWIAAQSVLRKRRGAPQEMKVTSLRDLPVGASTTFDYPAAHDACVLVRTSETELVAYSQKCTHLSCAVVPDVDKGVLRCPCHEGYFDLKTGANIKGPPPRPLPRVRLKIVGDDVFATGVDVTTKAG